MGLFQKNPDTITIRINGSTYDVPVAVAAHVSCLEAQYNTQKRRADFLKTERDHFLKLFKNVNSEATKLYIENRKYKHREEQNNKQGVKKMTYHEKLAKEHPEAIRTDEWGNCEGCPADYGYSDDHASNCPFGPSPVNCTRCWNREIPEEPKKPEEFAPGTSYVEFVDGHREVVTFYEGTAADGSILFTTCSGVYLFQTGIETLIMERPWDPHMKFRHDQLYRIEYDPDLSQPTMTAVNNIKFIAIDTRVKHEYCITLKDGRKVTGSVWVERDATDKQIRETVLNDAAAEVMTKSTDA